MSLVPLDIMKKGHAKDLLRELFEMIRSYNRSEMKTVMIHADNEFCSVEEEIEGKFDIPFNFANPGEHVGDIEIGNRFLEERFLCGVSSPTFFDTSNPNDTRTLCKDNV